MGVRNVCIDLSPRWGESYRICCLKQIRKKVKKFGKRHVIRHRTRKKRYVEMQGKENRYMEWYAKAEKRIEEKIKIMNLYGKLRNIAAEMAKEKDIKEREKKV
ncbi:hypothetical protein TNCV_3648701 [Trichonephila clavipes]|nr:hypothetical protein TNCV_3648701 [Trichonephila clavipes]